MFKNLAKYLLIFVVSTLLLISCSSRSPEPLVKSDLAKDIKSDLENITSPLANNVQEIDLYDAIAFAIKNNRDLRVKIMESALSNDQIELTQFDMLPKFAVDAGYKNLGRNPGSTSVTMTGQEPAELASNPSYSLSQDKSTTTTDIGFTWNALDFGLSYIRAGQNADKYLIAKEMERKAIQNITREVIYSYWQTLAADQLLAEIYPLMDRVNIALEDFEYIEELLISSPMDALLYQKELLDVAQVLLSQQRSLMNARTELSTLMGLLPGTEYKLIKTETPLTELDIDLETMEEAALFARPELMESRYMKRISSEEVRASMVALMPSLQFNSTWNYNSNKYLLNKSNYEFGSQIGGNLLNIFKAPLTKKAAEASQTVIEEQRLALSMAVLSQVHLSNINYAQSMREYSNARHYLNVSERINEQIKNAQKISRFGELEVIREEASMLVAKLRHDIAYAELQYSLGTIYASIGMDFTPDNIGNFSEKDLASFINESLGRWSKKYYAEVAIPIDEQDPVFKKKSAVLTDIDYRRSINYNIPLDPYFSEFSFSPQTFYLSGPGKVRYRVREANGKPLPNWLVFIPTERKFIGTSPDEIESLEISIEASNDVVQVKELFELKFQKKRKPITYYVGNKSKIDKELIVIKNESETLVIEENVDSVTTEINQVSVIANAVVESAQKEVNIKQETLSSSVNADLQNKVDNLQIKKKPIPNKSVLMATLTDTLSSKLHAITAYKSDQAAFIQIGAFQSENVSNKVAEDISKKIGEKVIVEPTFITEPIYYRILVGPTHKDSVFEVITKLVDIGIKDYFLTSS